ncbi:MAG: YlbF family regulator [Clostridia bacterium]|nr:YlbF family regulator [Clostridia bacterium]
MNIYDTANRLAYEIKNSEEYTNYKKLKEEVNKNLELKEKLETFEKERYEVQVAAISEGKKDMEKVSNMQKLYTELITIDVMKQYFDAELKFNVMLGDVNKIISEAVEDLIR